MKAGKTLVLVLLVIVLAFSVISQIQSNSVSAEEVQDCATTFYNEEEPVYDYVSHERSIYGDCIYYHNGTNCLNTTGPNTDCSIQTTPYQTICVNGEETYQAYGVVNTQTIQKNRTICNSKSFVITTTKTFGSDVKEIDFSSWGTCVQETEGNCVAILCGTQKGGSARDGIFNGCDGGKQCKKFLFCPDGNKVLYKAARGGFVEEDPTYKLPSLEAKEVEE